MLLEMLTMSRLQAFEQICRTMGLIPHSTPLRKQTGRFFWPESDILLYRLERERDSEMTLT